jgi:hypothetical protein
MKAAVVCNGPSRFAFNKNLKYNYTIGCNIPWTKVDSTVILDGNVIHRWAGDSNLISCPAFFTTRAWRTADEIRFRNYIIDNNLFIDLMPDYPEFYSAGHVAALVMCENDYTELDIFGVDSMFEDTVESFTNTLVYDFNPDSEQQRIVNWRLNWDKLQNDYPEVTFNFIKDTK